MPVGVLRKFWDGDCPGSFRSFIRPQWREPTQENARHPRPTRIGQGLTSSKRRKGPAQVLGARSRHLSKLCRLPQGGPLYQAAGSGEAYHHKAFPSWRRTSALAWIQIHSGMLLPIFSPIAL